MQSTIYQLSLVVGMGTLAILLIRGYSLMIALQRSGLVLISVLMVLLFSGVIIRWSVQPKPLGEDDSLDIGEDKFLSPEQIPGELGEDDNSGS